MTSCSHPKAQYIAHAGGCIDSIPYTNSLEAVEHALLCGISIIELDLSLTTDSVIVAAHDWPYFHKITGYIGDTTAISLKEFRSRKIYGKYTPITFFMIDSLMETNPNLYLMTDKISNPIILSQFSHRERIMIEAFGLKDYYQLDTMGFYKVFYSDSPKSYKKVFNHKIKRLLHMPTYVVPKRYSFWELGLGYENNTSNYWSAYGVEFAVFTVKSRHEADSVAALDRRIKYVYIDHVE